MFILILVAISAASFAIGIGPNDATAIKNDIIIIGLYDHEKRETTEEATEIDMVARKQSNAKHGSKYSPNTEVKTCHFGK